MTVYTRYRCDHCEYESEVPDELVQIRGVLLKDVLKQSATVTRLSLDLCPGCLEAIKRHGRIAAGRPA